jgi:chemotaxis protein CheX
MKSDFIHPFVDASAKVIEECTGTQIRRGSVSLIASPIPTLGVASIIGILGEAEGRMVMDLSPETACKLASSMNGQEIKEYDELVTSTINELANMVGGRAVSELVNRGHKLDITPPTLFSGREMEVSNTALETVVVPLDTDFGKIVLNIAMRLK